jgi:hypothetical protein
MDMPKPTEAHRQLHKLVGLWNGEERVSPSPWDPKGGPAVGRARNRLALDGFVVVQDYEQERNGKITYQGHGVFSWDAIGQGYVMHWWDSMGMAPSELRGNFESGVLVLTNADSQMHSRATWDLSKPGRYAFRMEVSQDGNQWYPFLEGNYTRQDQGAVPG